MDTLRARLGWHGIGIYSLQLAARTGTVTVRQLLYKARLVLTHSLRLYKTSWLNSRGRFVGWSTIGFMKTLFFLPVLLTIRSFVYPRKLGHTTNQVDAVKPWLSPDLDPTSKTKARDSCWMGSDLWHPFYVYWLHWGLLLRTFRMFKLQRAQNERAYISKRRELTHQKLNEEI